MAASHALRVYRGKDRFEWYQDEMSVFGLHGYQSVAQSEEGGHFHLGRLILSGGLSILAEGSGIRSGESLAVTYARTSATSAPAENVAALIRQLGELRDAGLLTEDEFAGEKAKLLARL